MIVALKIQDETSSGELVSEGIIRFPVESITVKDLIETRVTHEVDAFINSKVEIFSGSVQPGEKEKMLNGVRANRKKRIDLEKQKQVAVEAFQTNGFFLFVNGKQLTELDERILITSNTVVSFIRLMPLVGG